MPDYKTKLKNTIEKSKLNYHQKELWKLFLIVSRPAEDMAIYRAVEENEGNLLVLTNYFRNKIWKMKRNDKNFWKKIAIKESKLAKILA